jgi:hypothetical protein
MTKLGQKVLESEWQALLATRPTDPDAILRITYLAWVLGRESIVSDFIAAAAITLQNAVATRQAEANEIQQMAANLGGEAFRWLKSSAKLTSRPMLTLFVCTSSLGRRRRRILDALRRAGIYMTADV